MCQSSVWLQDPDGQMKKIADDVLVISQEGDAVLLHWLFSEPLRITGPIREVDAMKHKITIKVDSIPDDDVPPVKEKHAHHHPH